MARAREGEQEPGSIARHLSLVVLVAAAAIATLVTVRDDALPTLRRVWRLRSEPAIERSALFGFGAEFADYARFIRDQVPEDATLAIPKEVQGGEWGHLGIVQYFMFPRRVVDCPAEEAEACVLRLTGESTYILAPNEEFPPRQAAERNRTYLAFDERRGLFVPPGAAEGAPPP